MAERLSVSVSVWVCLCVSVFVVEQETVFFRTRRRCLQTWCRELASKRSRIQSELTFPLRQSTKRVLGVLLFVNWHWSREYHVVPQKEIWSLSG